MTDATMPRRDALGLALRRARRRRGLTQIEVSQRTGLSDKLISEIERGRRDVRFSTLGVLVENGLALSLAEFFASYYEPTRNGLLLPD